MSASKKVIVYTQPDCPPCEWLKRFLESKNIPFEAKDIRADWRAMREVMALGAKGTPVTVIGQEVVHGFDRERLSQLLES